VEDLDDIPDYDVQDVPSNVAIIVHALRSRETL